METVKGSVVSRGQLRAEGTQAGTEDFQGREPVLYSNTVLDTCHYPFVQTHKCTTSRVNSKVNYGPWVIMTCQRRFIKCNKGATQVLGVYGGERLDEQRGIWEL